MKLQPSLEALGTTADRKFFDLDEANRSLPYVGRVVEDVVVVYREIVDLRREMEGTEDEADLREVEREYEEAMDRLGAFVDELHAVGVELKDFERGVVDFPAWYGEREVLLCWQPGEAAITFWHEVDQGYAGRQPVRVLGACVATRAA